MLFKLVLALTVALTITPPKAWAVARSEAGSAMRRERARKLFAQAEWHFTKARYRAALRDYDRAFALSGLPGFLLNMAHCHVRLHNVREARRIYRLYLQRSSESDPRRQAVQDALAQLSGQRESQSAIADDEAEGQETSNAPVADVAAARSTPRAGPPPTSEPVQMAFVPADVKSGGMDLSAMAQVKHDVAPSRWAWALAGAAVVAAGVAIFFVARHDGDIVREGSLGSLSR